MYGWFQSPSTPRRSNWPFCRCDLHVRVRTCETLRLGGRQVLAVGLFDLHLDRHAVAVPARHVRRVEPGHRPVLDDDVLQDLVDGMADVDVAVGVGRAVVQHEARASGARLADRLVDLALLPFLDPAGLALARDRRASGTPYPAGSASSCSRFWYRQACVSLRVGDDSWECGGRVSATQTRASPRNAQTMPARRRHRPESGGSAWRGRDSAPRLAACAGIRPRRAGRRLRRRNRR